MKDKNDKRAIHLSYPLLDNALDFLLHAAEHVGEDSPRSWKYAVSHLVSGIELLLKAKLETEHWSLVFQEPDKANSQLYKSGDFQSVDFESVIRRLGGISSVTVSQSEREQLNNLKKLRNKIEHFGIDMDLTQIKALMAKGLSYAVSFYETNLKEETEDYDKEILGEIIKHLQEFEEFVTERLKMIIPNISKYAILTTCPKCQQHTLEIPGIVEIADEVKLHCHFCGVDIDSEEMAEERSEHRVEICPECGNRTLALIVYNNESAGWQCFACGQEYDNLNRCSTCDNLFSGDGPMCQDCMSGFMDKD